MSSTAVTIASATGRALTPTSWTGPMKTRQGAQSQEAEQRQQGQQIPQTPDKSLSPAPPQPGTWKHPKMDEIARRQNAATFNTDNVNRAVFHATLLLSSLILPSLVYNYLPQAAKTQIDPLVQYQIYPAVVIRLYLLLNILLALRPLVTPKDEINDIPLTPSQRALLGLRPNSTTPLTPSGQYVTPPRYSRSVTPRSNGSSRGDSQSPYSGSPLTGRDRSGSVDRSMMGRSRAASGSPYSGSPLIQKALSGSTTRRLSFDGGNAAGSIANSPTPSVGTGRASVGLNNKWLYERARSSPNGRGLFA